MNGSCCCSRRRSLHVANKGPCPSLSSCTEIHSEEGDTAQARRRISFRYEQYGSNGRSYSLPTVKSIIFFENSFFPRGILSVRFSRALSRDRPLHMGTRGLHVKFEWQSHMKYEVKS